VNHGVAPRSARVEAELAVAKARAPDDQALIAHQRLQIEKLTCRIQCPRYLVSGALGTNPLYSPVIDGTRRSLVSVAGKDGILRALDRESHEQIYAVPLTTLSDADAEPTIEGVHTCPGVLGGFQWSSPAYNPATNVLVAPTVDWCGVFKKAGELRYIPGQLYMGGSYTSDPVEQSRGWLTAVNASTGAIVWKYQSKRPLLASVTITSANLVFTGELTGDFVVMDASQGDILYRFNIGGPVTAGLSHMR
jgi:alcohol dehydrogenase (cytochrome c)